MVDSKSETFWFATDKSFSIRAAHALEHSSSPSTGEFVVSKVASVVNGEIVVVVSLSEVCVDSVAGDVEFEGNSEDKFSVVGAREGSVEGSVENSVEGSVEGISGGVDSVFDDVELEGDSEDRFSVVGAREGSVEDSVEGITDDSEELDSDEDDSDDVCGLLSVAVT